MRTATLITQNGLDLPCVVLPVERNLFPIGKEVLVYCQNRLAKGYIETDEDLIAELEIIAEFAIIPELDEFLRENMKETRTLTEIYYV